MSIDFSSYPLVSDAFSNQPFSFVSTAISSDLARLVEMDLVENGTSTARELWQSKQLINVMQHARSRSKFWNKRLPAGVLNASVLSQLPVLSRRELAAQVAEEGSLVSLPDHAQQLRSNITSGSTGTPISVYITPQNGYYNRLRSTYEYFRLGWPVTENRTRISIFDRELLESPDQTYSVKRAPNWIGNLSGLFQNGSYLQIGFKYIDDQVIHELEKQSLGYINCGNFQIQLLLEKLSIQDLKALGVKAWIQRGGTINPDLNRLFLDTGMKTHSNYSCEETGVIAQQCQVFPDCFHGVHSNVIIERDKSLETVFEGRVLSRVLITNLHSYATPLIRYDVGDFAEFHDGCPCGHEGLTLSHIFGRSKHFLHLKNGTFRDVFVGTDSARSIVDFKEWRFIQHSYSEVEMVISGVAGLSDEQKKSFKILTDARFGSDFDITMRFVDEIDWSDNPKRLFFVSRIKDDSRV